MTRPRNGKLTVYRIKDWNDHFEKAQTRKLSGRDARWVPVPIKHDGLGYRRLMARKNAGDVFAAWILLVQVAAKCPERGVLRDGDRPLTPDDLELKTGFAAHKFASAIQVLSGSDIGWLEVVEEWEGSGSGLPLQYSTVQDKTGQDRTPVATTANAAAAPSWAPETGFADIGEEDRARWSAAYPACDISRQLSQMDDWLRANPSKAHKSNWRRFITNWLSRAQDRGGDVPSNKRQGSAWDRQIREASSGTR